MDVGVRMRGGVGGRTARGFRQHAGGVLLQLPRPCAVEHVSHFRESDDTILVLVNRPFELLKPLRCKPASQQ